MTGQGQGRNGRLTSQLGASMDGGYLRWKCGDWLTKKKGAKDNDVLCALIFLSAERYASRT